MIQEKRNNCLNLVRISNRKINEVRYSESESEDHIAMKRDICTQLILDGKQFITEAIFETGGRADILILDDFEVIEIVNTEKEESLINKSKRYPKGLKIKVVRIH